MPHYFTGQPDSPAERRPLQVMLGGRPVEVLTASGVFSSSRLDLGTSVLLRTLAGSEPVSGTALDLGCGWGPIGLHLALSSPQLRVIGIDINERAVELTNENARLLGAANLSACTPSQLDKDLRFDAIWSNPPIRIGKDALHALLAAYLPRLVPGGAAHLVVSKNLGADSLARWLSGDLGMPAVKVASAKGYRVLRVTHPA